MKNYLKYTGVCAAILAIVSFILILCTAAIKSDTLLGDIDGEDALFGFKVLTVEYKGASAGIFGFILLLASIILLVVGAILPALNKHFNGIAGILNLIAAIALIVAGIFILCTKNSWYDVNKDNLASAKSAFDLSVTYAISGVIAIVAGCIAALPAISDFKK